MGKARERLTPASSARSARRTNSTPDLGLPTVKLGYGQKLLEHLRAERFVDHDNLTVRVVVLFVGKLTL